MFHFGTCKNHTIIVLQKNTYILSLDLEDNWLEEEGGEYIGDMLQENCYISELVRHTDQFVLID